jgi:hypothetical protein
LEDTTFDNVVAVSYREIRFHVVKPRAAIT